MSSSSKSVEETNSVVSGTNLPIADTEEGRAQKANDTAGSISNPFVVDDEVESQTTKSNRSGKRSFEEDEIDSEVDSDKPVFDMHSVKQRGALISGVPPSPENGSTSLHHDDLETGSDPTGGDSDYVNRPRSLWQTTSSTSTSDIRHRAENLGSESDRPGRKPRKASLLWVALALTSLILTGIIVVVAKLVFGGNDNSDGGDDASNGDIPAVLTTRQQMLSDIIDSLSDASDLSDTTSPQSRARKWLLFEDELLLDPAAEHATERVIQRYSLAVFHYATGGPTFWQPNNWLQSDECGGAFWDGLYCNDDSEVLTLAMDREGLVGKIPKEIGHLTKLENLVLKNESELSGTIPSTVGKLTNLKQFGLYFTKLSGPLPSELFMPSGIKYLNLQDNALTGTLSPAIGNLRELQTLVLTNNQFEGAVPFEKLSFGKLHYLGLSSNKFSGSIEPSVGYYPELRYLYLDHNEFDGQLPTSLGSASNLKSMNLDQNRISGEITSDLGRLRKLEYLSLQGNGLEGTLPSEIGLMTSLKTFNLDSNKLSGQLPDLSKLRRLEKVLLSRNQFSGRIPGSLVDHDILDTLFLSSNKLTGTIPTFQTTHSIRGIYLSDNQLSGSIPESICDLTSLEALFLDENQIDGSIPLCINQLSNLEQLFLFGNALTGEIPVELSALKLLNEIGLENNQITGTVPADMCSATAELDFWSDCGGDSPKVACPCCNVCCPSDDCV